MKKRSKKGLAVLVAATMLSLQIFGVTAVYAENGVLPSTPEPEATVVQGAEATSLPEPETTNTPQPETTAFPEAEATSLTEPEATNTPQSETTVVPEAEATSLPEPEATNTPQPENTAIPEETAVPEIDVQKLDEVDEQDVHPKSTVAPKVEQPKTTDGVKVRYEYDWDNELVKLYYDIGEDAKGDVVLDFSVVTDALNDAYRELKGDPDAVYTAVPSDSNNIDIEIITSNGHTYRYKDGSFRMETQNNVNPEELTDFVGFDGKLIPLESIGAIARSEPMQKLFDVYSSGSVKLNHILDMYKYLEEAGYTGKSALTNYLLDYYNEKLGTEYKDFEELAKENPEAIVNMNGGAADDQFYITKEEYEDLCKRSPEYFGKYSVAKDMGNGKVRLQVKWPEQEVAAASYELFYKELISFVFGDKQIQEDFKSYKTKWHLADLGLKDYMENTEGTWSKVNEYLKQATAAGLSKDDAGKLAISMAFGIDGPWTNNSYQLFHFMWYNSIEMEQIDGNVTINKVDENGTKIVEPATFKLYYYKVKELDNGGEEKEKYYYAIDENGNGYFTMDEAKAAALATKDGSLTVKYLVPDYKYYLQEISSPNGYVIGNQPIEITIKSKETVVIDVMNAKATPEPTDEPKPTPTPEPSNKPTPKPSETPKPTDKPKTADKPKATPQASQAPKAAKPSPKTSDSSMGRLFANALIAVLAITVLILIRVKTKKKK